MINRKFAISLSLPAVLPLLGACGGMIPMSSTSPTPATPVPGIERVQLEDNQLTCKQIKANFEGLEPLVQQARDTSALTAGITAAQTDYAAMATGTMTAAQIGASAAPDMASAMPFVEGALSALSLYNARKSQDKALEAASTQQRAYEAKARREHLAGLYLNKECK